MTALTDWADQLAAWAIPDAVLARAVESPWVLPRTVFVRRADAQIADPVGATHAAAIDALGRGGSVLDVGAAAGATSLSLVGRAAVSQVVAVDGDADLLASFGARATALGVPTRVLCGHWPDVADRAGVADVVMCGNVVYNVPDLEPFVRRLTRCARRQVIVETAAAHPLTELNALWHRFHGITRPAGPTAPDFVAALGELGITPQVLPWRREPEAEHESFADLVDVTRRRLCLPPDASDEVRSALLELGVDPELPPDLGSSGRELVTLTWPGTTDPE